MAAQTSAQLPSANPNLLPRPLRPGVPGPDEVLIRAIHKEVRGSLYKLRGNVRIETRDSLLEADEIDYDEETAQAEARGRVHFQHFAGNEELWAERVDYNLREETGRFYEVRGTSPAKINPRPGVLTTTNPFVFEGKWAQRLKDRYILYDGFVTNCKMPNPVWTLRAPVFDIIPNDRAIAHKAWFKIRQFPLFYAPVFYKSLKRQPRQSGFLTPNIGNSSRRGKMLGAGYYWAINRSFDLSYRSQLFTQRGFAHTVDFRGKPTQSSEFNFYLYGVNDRGLDLGDGRRLKQGGYLISFDGRADLGRGFTARGEANYLSSFSFRQAFTETFNEAIFSEVQSVGFITRQTPSYALNLVLTRKDNFQSLEPGDQIAIRRLPQIEFSTPDRKVNTKILPVWISLDSTAGLLRRSQPLFQTRSYVHRADLEPRVMTALGWRGFRLIPAFAVRETYVGSSFLPQEGSVSGDDIRRHARELSLDLVTPALERVFTAPRWMGSKLKHVIEPRAGFRHVRGIDRFADLIRFDETELLSNTTEAEISLANRFYLKSIGGQVWEAFSWQLWHRRYFDPTFGGALSEEGRNVLASSFQITGYSFLFGPRRYSPVVSAFRAAPRPNLSLEWRADYDPLLGRLSNSTFTADARLSNYFVSIGHAQVRGSERLSPPFNQFRGLIGIGNENRRGWNAAFSAFYDFRLGIMQFATTQITYNLNCCGISGQYRLFNFGARKENQFRVAFVIANIGSFGTLKRQDRIF